MASSIPVSWRRAKPSYRQPFDTEISVHADNGQCRSIIRTINPYIYLSGRQGYQGRHSSDDTILSALGPKVRRAAARADHIPCVAGMFMQELSSPDIVQVVAHVVGASRLLSCDITTNNTILVSDSTAKRRSIELSKDLCGIIMRLSYTIQVLEHFRYAQLFQSRQL
jgi:hypothetical protein